MLEPLRQGLPPLDPAAVSDTASCALPARFEAVREARRFTRSTLDQWDIGDCFDDACLVVSELVTNALRHGLPPEDSPRVPAPREPSSRETSPREPSSRGTEHGPPVRLHLMRWTGRLVCAVRDPSRESPLPREVEDFSAESGRGLLLVDSFADGWGWHPLSAKLGGKVVWALFRLRTPAE
ncbi:ATP-binding protein [Streptomyces sp. NPDC006172]|uniref:ATP-binding protein n=1 Tax=Streptomyces sp. NPDC006172 TaxID=3154470 RepID=UPI0033DDE280